MKTNNMYFRRRAKIAAILTAIQAVGLAGVAQASGYLTEVHTGPAMARAGAVTATIDDPSAVWHNPAGLTATEGTYFLGSLTLIRPAARYVGPGFPSTNPNPGSEVSASAKSPLIPVPAAFVAHALSPKAVVGFGFYVPYGLAMNWENPTQFVGRTVSQEAELRAYFMTPTIALRLSEKVSVALGVSLVPATVFLKRTVGASDNGEVLLRNAAGEEAQVEISGDAFGVGMTAGVQVSLIDHLALGLVYRSAIALDFTGNANFILPSGTPAEIAANFPDQTGSASLTIPHTLNLGAGWKTTDFTAELSCGITFWSSTKELAINFDTGRPSPVSSSPRDWTVAPRVVLSGEYWLDQIALRAGLGYDVSPVPTDTLDPTLPDSDRVLVSLGAGYNFGTVQVDLAYLAVLVQERTVTAEDNNKNFAVGTYEASAVHLLSLSAGVKI
ncbi:MAG: outer membrane protein transport protein [Deltaproteobacteria bacterium]|nr:outer membrane protein transport protein [Deltaproteobacteria bacterium]